MGPANSPKPIPLLVLVSIAAAVSALAGVFLATWSWNFYQLTLQSTDTYQSGFQDYATDFTSSANCNVLGIQIHGQIVGSRADIPLADTLVMQQSDGSTYLLAPNYTIADEVEDVLRNAKTNENIKGIIVDIDSGGGVVVGGQEIAVAIKRLAKPSVALIRDLGASAAYLSASATDEVLASRDSSVGSIGVTSSFVTQTSKTTKEGLVFEQLSSGPFKDTFNPEKPLNDAERALIMRDVKISRDHFVSLVSEYRSIPYEDVDKIADGSTVLGSTALELGLIDGIGGIGDAIDSLERQLGEPVSICWQ